MHRPLRIRRVGERRFAVDGTPTDCVLLALQIVIKDGPVDLVLSGVNHGGNLGEDVTYSGTIAAAMEATLFNVPAIALSQVCRNGQPVKWATAEQHAPAIIERLFSKDWPEGCADQRQLSRLRRRARSSGYAGDHPGQAQARRRAARAHRPARRNPMSGSAACARRELPGEGTDLAAVADGYISITPIHMDMTHRASLQALRGLLE